MTVPAKAFQRWRFDVAPNENLADLCRRAGFKRATLAQQLVRGRVSVSAVIAIARGLGLQPVASLSAFDHYRSLAAGMREPSRDELLSQVSHLDVLEYLVARSRCGDGEPPTPGPYPHPASVRMWIDAIDTGELRQRMATVAEVAPQNISASIMANRLSPSLALAASTLTGVSSTSGFVVTGELTPAEGGWPSDGRERALMDCSDAEVVLLAQGRLEEMAKSARKLEREDQRARDLWETLG